MNNIKKRKNQKFYILKKKYALEKELNLQNRLNIYIDKHVFFEKKHVFLFQLLLARYLKKEKIDKRKIKIIYNWKTNFFFSRKYVGAAMGNGKGLSKLPSFLMYKGFCFVTLYGIKQKIIFLFLQSIKYKFFDFFVFLFY